jgi:glycosyltransferase involved in cell wall biosynthesis
MSPAIRRRRDTRGIRDARKTPHVTDASAQESNGRGKIRVTYVGHVAQLSGGEIALMRLIDALDEVDAHVILAEPGPLVERLRAAGVSVEVLPMRERTRNLRKDRVRPNRLPITALIDTLTYTFRLARRLRAIRPDLVHTNTLKAGIYGSLAGRLARVPVVWHVRDRIAPDYLSRPAVFLIRGLIATLPAGVIANSESTRTTLWRTRADTRVVYSLVSDPVTWHPLHYDHARRDHFVVGMVGRIAPWKGQHVFLQAFAKVFRSGTELATIVGDAMFGAAEVRYGDELRELATRLGIAERVEFRGFQEDIWAELDLMDILVHASVTPEPFGQVIVEAMLAGVPVIAVAGGGPSEIVTDGVDGLLYPAGDVDALAQDLRRLRDDPNLRARLSDAARVRAERFSPQAAAGSVMALYRRVLAASTR